MCVNLSTFFYLFFFSETQTGERDASWAGMDQSVTPGRQRATYHVTQQPASVSLVVLPSHSENTNKMTVCV